MIELEHREEIRSRLKKMDFYWGFLLFLLVLAATSFPAVRFSMGSFPFLWVFLLFGFFFANVFALGVSEFFKRESDNKENSSKQQEITENTKNKNVVVITM
jgi:4-hydroxybenzoate polyprenyltransferase